MVFRGLVSDVSIVFYIALPTSSSFFFPLFFLSSTVYVAYRVRLGASFSFPPFNSSSLLIPITLRLEDAVI